MKFGHVKEGDEVVRNMAGILIPLKVTKVEDGLIHCGPWTFDVKTGAEVDEDLRWGPRYGITGSVLMAKVE